MFKVTFRQLINQNIKKREKRVENILHIAGLGKTYQSAGHTLTVLDDINFSVTTGSTNAIVGPSGSGKTTLLGLCAGLDRATSGIVELNNINLGKLSEDQ